MSSGFLTRRNFVSTSTFAVAVALSNFVSADNARDAEVLVGKLVADINNVISSGNSERLMVKQFEEIFKLTLMYLQLLDMLWGLMRDLFQNPKWKGSQKFTLFMFLINMVCGFESLSEEKLSFKNRVQSKVFLRWKH